MSKPQPICEEQFRIFFGDTLGSNLDRAVRILNNFGPRLSLDITNIMLHAVEQEKEKEVLDILEEHWEEHFQSQHPDIRGTVKDEFGINLTKQILRKICMETLELSVSVS